jgi:hypothetical protein
MWSIFSMRRSYSALCRTTRKAASAVVRFEVFAARGRGQGADERMHRFVRKTARQQREHRKEPFHASSTTETTERLAPSFTPASSA